MAQIEVSDYDGARITLQQPDDPVEKAQMAELLHALASEVTSPDELRANIISALPAGTNNIGNVDVVTLPAPPASIFAGQKTVTTAGTPEALAATQAITKSVTVKALASNTTAAYVQPNGALGASGFELAPGEASPPIEVADLATVFVDVATSGQGVSYVAS